MSSIVGGTRKDVLRALQDFAREGNGCFEPASLSLEDEDCMVITSGNAGLTVMYPFQFIYLTQASQFLSQTLGAAVFSFHIHDSDFWMYQLFDKGEAVDEFNPVPDYFGEFDDDDVGTCEGDANAVAQRVPGLRPEAVAPYLVRWSFDGAQGKAHADDEYSIGDDWQLVDFMKRLGFAFPIDRRGKIQGETYRFQHASYED